MRYNITFKDDESVILSIQIGSTIRYVEKSKRLSVKFIIFNEDFKFY